VILYKLLLGQFPYEVVGSVLDIIKNIQEIEPEKPSKIKKINSEVEIIVLKALAKEPQHRYQSASEFLHDIDNWLKGYPIIARADNSLYLFYKLIRRHRFTASVAALLMVIIISFGAVSFDLYRTADAAQGRAEVLADKRYEQMQLYRTLSKKITFTMFLQAWREDDLKRAGEFRRLYESMYEGDSAARNAAAFLLNVSPFTEKEGDSQEVLGASESWLADFIKGEEHFKAGQKDEALIQYKQSLGKIETLQESFEPSDRWFKEIILSRLEALRSDLKQAGN
jgi:serine/threonine protein kinase